MKKLLVTLTLLIAPMTGASGLKVYGILAAIDDEMLVLMDRFSQRYLVHAKTYCWSTRGFDEGDVVYSLDDLSFCTSATLISKRGGETCEVWCN